MGSEDLLGRVRSVSAWTVGPLLSVVVLFIGLWIPVLRSVQVEDAARATGHWSGLFLAFGAPVAWGVALAVGLPLSRRLREQGRFRFGVVVPRAAALSGCVGLATAVLLWWMVGGPFTAASAGWLLVVSGLVGMSGALSFWLIGFAGRADA